MKKFDRFFGNALIAVFVVVGLIMAFILGDPSGYVADAYIGGDTMAVKSFSIKNVSGEPLVTCIPITTIVPGVNKLVGWSILPALLATVSETESFLELWDTAGPVIEVTDESYDEVEAMDGADHEWWEAPRYVINGVTVRQGTNTTVQIFFI